MERKVFSNHYAEEEDVFGEESSMSKDKFR